MTTLNRKAWGDLTRHPARTVLTVCTLGLAIASLATFAMPGLMDRTMQGEVRAARLHDIAITTRDLMLSTAQLDALSHLPNVAAFDAGVVYSTRAAIGGRRQEAVVWGLDLASRPVDAVRLIAGRLPQPGQLLADSANSQAASFAASIGDHVVLDDRAGGRTTWRVAGTAHSLATAQSTGGQATAAVFYGTADSVRSLAAVEGINALAFRLVDTSASAEDRAIATVHTYLRAQTGTEPFIGLPERRAAGDWPGRAAFQQITSLLYIITGLAVLSAVFLIANTMNTFVVEQAGDIAILKTLGGRRHQIAGIVVRTASLIGAAGALLGTGLGIAITYLVTRWFASTFFFVRVGFAVSVPMVVTSLAVGPALAIIASLPGLRRALRRPAAEILADRGVAGYGTARLDRLVARSHLVPGPAKMGFRNALRRKRRSAATVAQIAVATALALALFAAGRSVTVTVNGIYTTLHYNVAIVANKGAPALDTGARSIAGATTGVTRVAPVLESGVRYKSHDYPAWGFDGSPLYQYQLRAGRWFTPADNSAAPPAVVLGPAIARSAHARVGQTLMLDTAAGVTAFRVIGIDTGQVDNGYTFYFPLAALQRLTGRGEATNSLWITTANSSHTAIDQVAGAAQDRLAAAGYPVDIQKLYVQAASNRAQNNALVAVFEILGLLVVAITLIGLVSTLTMGVIERTREIGILRCLGARARQVRRVFGAEGITLATAGWAVGIPLGWLLFRALLVLIRQIIGIDLEVVFPTSSLPVALFATIAVTALVIRTPLRRATRIHPGTALRYQ